MTKWSSLHKTNKKKSAHKNLTGWYSSSGLDKAMKFKTSRDITATNSVTSCYLISSFFYNFVGRYDAFQSAAKKKCKQLVENPKCWSYWWTQIHNLLFCIINAPWLRIMQIWKSEIQTRHKMFLSVSRFYFSVLKNFLALSMKLTTKSVCLY